MRERERERERQRESERERERLYSVDRNFNIYICDEKSIKIK